MEMVVPEHYLFESCCCERELNGMLTRSVTFLYYCIMELVIVIAFVAVLVGGKSVVQII
jgi:hypothetical protein